MCILVYLTLWPATTFHLPTFYRTNIAKINKCKYSRVILSVTYKENEEYTTRLLKQ